MSVYQESYHLPEFTYDYEMLKIEQRGPVYICSFNDAKNLNAMSYKQMSEFNDFLIKVRLDKDCRVIVLTGEGKSFCAGFNLNDLALDPPEDMGRIQRDFYVMQRMCSDQIVNMRLLNKDQSNEVYVLIGALSFATLLYLIVSAYHLVTALKARFTLVAALSHATLYGVVGVFAVVVIAIFAPLIIAPAIG